MSKRGGFWQWDGAVLQEEYRKDMTLKEAEVVALSTLKQVMEEKVGTLPRLATAVEGWLRLYELPLSMSCKPSRHVDA